LPDSWPDTVDARVEMPAKSIFKGNPLFQKTKNKREFYE